MDDRARELHDVVEKLIALGEEADELRYWESIFADLSDDEKSAIVLNLKSELAALERS
ncbi:MAG TPA: hypothetical protein VMA75_00950 [Candidatus Paceibacterota bacterium]|nr:hypothetical protein [Candidatus Paceibacterota bacterium]